MASSPHSLPAVLGSRRAAELWPLLENTASPISYGSLTSGRLSVKPWRVRPGGRNSALNVALGFSFSCCCERLFADSCTQPPRCGQPFPPTTPRSSAALRPHLCGVQPYSIQNQRITADEDPRSSLPNTCPETAGIAAHRPEGRKPCSLPVLSTRGIRGTHPNPARGGENAASCTHLLPKCAHSLVHLLQASLLPLPSLLHLPPEPPPTPPSQEQQQQPGRAAQHGRHRRHGRPHAAPRPAGLGLPAEVERREENPGRTAWQGGLGRALRSELTASLLGRRVGQRGALRIEPCGSSVDNVCCSRFVLGRMCV